MIRASYSVMRIERGTPCTCSANRRPHFLSREIRYLVPDTGARIQERLCDAGYDIRSVELLERDDIAADLPDEALERFAAQKIQQLRERIAQLDGTNDKLAALSAMKAAADSEKASHR